MRGISENAAESVAALTRANRLDLLGRQRFLFSPDLEVSDEQSVVAGEKMFVVNLNWMCGFPSRRTFITKVGVFIM